MPIELILLGLVGLIVALIALLFGKIGKFLLVMFKKGIDQNQTSDSSEDIHS